jgi:hypothetical protein
LHTEGRLGIHCDQAYAHQKGSSRNLEKQRADIPQVNPPAINENPESSIKSSRSL